MDGDMQIAITLGANLEGKVNIFPYSTCNIYDGEQTELFMFQRLTDRGCIKEYLHKIGLNKFCQ